jgi:hypothetical protein
MVDGQAGLHTQRNEPDLALATLRTVQPVLEARGTPTRTYGFYQVVALRRVLQNRYRVDEIDIATMRKAVTAAAQGDDEKDVGYATFFLGRLLLLRGDVAAAREQLENSLTLAERIGESQLLAQSLLSLTVTALRRGDIAAVRSLTPRAMTAASAMASAGAQTGVKACLAWLAWHDQRPEDVVTLAKEIAEQRAAAGRFAVFYGWVYLWPLVAVHLEAGDIGEAIAASRQLLDPEQERPPDELESALTAAHGAWDRGQREMATEKLTVALALARSLHYS